MSLRRRLVIAFMVTAGLLLCAAVVTGLLVRSFLLAGLDRSLGSLPAEAALQARQLAPPRASDIGACSTSEIVDAVIVIFRTDGTASEVCNRLSYPRVPYDELGLEVGEATGPFDERGEDEVTSVARALNGMLDEVERSFEAQQASERRLRRFVEDASHELRTPLTSIQGYSEMHLQGMLADPARLSGAMSRINAEALRMNRLVNDMLTVARLDDEPEMAMAQVDVAAMARLAAADAAAIDTGWPVTVDAPDRAEIVADPDAVHQALANLLANARAHTPRGTRVRVSVTSLARKVRIVVEDEGPGIPADVLPDIFERFVRADPARSRANSGAGLGLSIVKLLVRAHGGTVRAGNVAGGGARFVVELPTSETSDRVR